MYDFLGRKKSEHPVVKKDLNPVPNQTLKLKEMLEKNMKKIKDKLRRKIGM